MGFVELMKNISIKVTNTFTISLPITSIVIKKNAKLNCSTYTYVESRKYKYSIEILCDSFEVKF